MTARRAPSDWRYLGLEVIERIDMPAGVLGFRLTGKLKRSDYTEALIPALREVVDRGDKIRAVFQIGPDFHGMEAGALWEDIKADLTLGLPHRSSWGRIAVVSDESWVGPAFAALGWMAPGEISTFGLDALEAAKSWVAGSP